MKLLYIIIIMLTLNVRISAQSVNTDWVEKNVLYPSKENTYLNIGDTIPNFDIYINEQTRKFKEITKDSYTFINLWSNNLEFTLAYNLELKYFYDKLLVNNNYNSKIISICLGNETKWQRDINKYNISWLNAFSKDDSCLNNWFDLSEFPCGIVIDNNGVILLNKVNSMIERANAFNMLLKTQTNNKNTKEKNKNNLHNNSITTLNVLGKNLEDYQLRIDDNIYIDTLKAMNTIDIAIDEPTRISVINANDTMALLRGDYKYISTYIENGVNYITLDLDKSTFYSNTSMLVNDYNKFWQLKKRFDALLYTESDYEDNNTQLKTNNNKFDSISHLYHREYYNRCLTLPKSFITLKFVLFLTDGYLHTGITRKEVVSLFNLLDKSLFKYPTYIKTKKIIEDNFLNNTIELDDTIAKPLWNPN